jgi:hypothetical protein
VVWLYFLVAFLAVCGVAAVINWRRSHTSHEAKTAAQLEQARAQSRWPGPP